MVGVGAATQAGAGYMNGVLIMTGASEESAATVVQEGRRPRRKQLRTDDDDIMEIAMILAPMLEATWAA